MLQRKNSTGPSAARNAFTVPASSPSTSRSASRKVFGYRAPTNAIPPPRGRSCSCRRSRRCRARRCSSSPFAWRSEQATSASDCWYLTSSTPRLMDTPPLVTYRREHGLGLRLRHEQQEGERRVIDADIEQPAPGGSAAAVQPNLDRIEVPEDQFIRQTEGLQDLQRQPAQRSRDSNDRSTARSTRRTESPEGGSSAQQGPALVVPHPTTRTSHEPPLPATTQSPRRDARRTGRRRAVPARLMSQDRRWTTSSRDRLRRREIS